MRTYFFSILCLLLFSGKLTFAASDIHIIPEPHHMERKAGTFKLQASTTLKYNNEEARDIIDVFQKEIGAVTGYALSIAKAASSKVKNSIFFEVSSGSDQSKLGKEGYELRISSAGVHLKAHTAHGLFNGIQSIKQLFPKEIEAGVLIS